MKDAREIAGRLSKAQREAILATRPNSFGSYWLEKAGAGTIRALNAAYLTEDEVRPTRLSEKGLAVRTILQEQSHDS